MKTDTWREMIALEMERAGESFVNMVAMTPPDLDLDRKFDSGYGSAEGKPFTLWTVDRVYFPVQYDGSEWVQSVPRNPNDEATDHVGGG